MPSLADRFASPLPQRTFADIRAERDALSDTDPRQQLLALEDRRAFAREFTRERPILGTASLAVLSPIEQLVKALGFQQGRSGFFDPLANIGATFTGIGEGLQPLPPPPEIPDRGR